MSLRADHFVPELVHIALRRCPLLIQLEIGGVLLALVMSAWLSLVAANPETRTESVALPAAQDVDWETRAGNFAARIAEAFDVDATTARRYAEWTLDAAARHHVDPELLASLIYVESTFDTEAISERGAVGPAQVMPGVWASICRGDLRDPADNIDCGARILAAYVDDCGSVSCALVSYNAGPAALARGTRVADRYVARIDWHRDRLERVRSVSTSRS